MMRRATMVSFGRLWEWIARAPMIVRLPDPIMAEYFSACCLLPLCYPDLRLSLSEEVSATDASEEAGGICRTIGLTTKGVAASH